MTALVEGFLSLSVAVCQLLSLASQGSSSLVETGRVETVLCLVAVVSGAQIFCRSLLGRDNFFLLVVSIVNATIAASLLEGLSGPRVPCASLSSLPSSYRSFI